MASLLGLAPPWRDAKTFRIVVLYLTIKNSIDKFKAFGHSFKKRRKVKLDA